MKPIYNAVRIVMLIGIVIHAINPVLAKGPESYMPKGVDGVDFKTCIVDVTGKATCDPRNLGDAATDTVRLGLTMLPVCGLKGTDDKRWNSVLYGVTTKSCVNGGVSVGVMQTHAGVSKVAQKELEGFIASKKLSMKKESLDGQDGLRSLDWSRCG